MRTCSVIAFVLVTLAGGEISRGQDKSKRDTVVGTWVLKALKVDDEDQPAGREPGYMPKIGTLYKFRKNGTCLFEDKECKYKFSNEDRELIIEANSETYEQKIDVKFKTVAGKDQMILRWTVSSLEIHCKCEMLFDAD